MKVCFVTGCPNLTHKTRCVDCERAREKARGSAAARGYGPAHKSERERWAPIVATGHVKCARCREPIAVGAAWDLDHRDDDRTRYLGPSHSTCNRSTSGRTSPNN